MNKTETSSLERTWLIQRLSAPYPNSKLNPFAFGGGLKNGGLSEEAMDLLGQFFSFDYMGSAEFEWGAIPKSIQRIATNISEYVTSEIIINKTPVYILCNEMVVADVEKLLHKLSKKDVFLKESSMFDASLGLSKWVTKEKSRTIGWLELDNNFMFFTSKDSFEGVTKLFGVKPQNFI